MTKKVLIVEDERDIRDLICATLDSENFEIICAKDGGEALEIVRANSPDVIVLDIQLPKINGDEVCRLLRADPKLSSIKVLMLSGVTQNIGSQKSRLVGADGYITKPFSPLQLLAKIKSL